MKIINSVVVLMTLVCGSQMSHGVKLECGFRDIRYDIGTLYSCDVTFLVNPHNNVTIEGYLGEHLANKNDADVKGIWIHETNTKYIPTNLGSLFNLTAFVIQNSQLMEIKAKDFDGMENLESIGFVHNKFSSVPLDVFATLTKLRAINLNSNQIEELPNDIFKNNLDLEEIHLYENKIKYLGTEIFNSLRKLNYVELRNNICVNKLYNGTTEINKMKHDIKMNCDIPNDAIDFKLNVIMKQQLNAMDVQQKDQVEIEKLRKELIEAKDAEQKVAIELRNLKQDLLEAKQMNERIPKMEREIYDLNKNIFDIKEQRRMERSTFIEVKGKLKRAEEQLASCENDPAETLIDLRHSRNVNEI